jgi:F420-dependent oxidoreductase-like protein
VRFAFKTANHNTTWSDILAVWREADGMEVFESGWLFDHYYPIWSPQGPGDPAGPCLEGWTMLAGLAQATSRLRLGTMVTGVHYRHPAVLANMAATIDIMSDGRLELGIGAGWNEEESGAYGIGLGTAAERSDRLEEACQVLIGLLAQETTTFLGEHFALVDARCGPKGPQRPHPPLVFGGSGEKRTLLTAARYAQHWNFLGGTPDEFAQKRTTLIQHCTDIGRDPDEIILSNHVWLNSGSDADLAAMARQISDLADVGLDLAIVYSDASTQPGNSPAVG